MIFDLDFLLKSFRSPQHYLLLNKYHQFGYDEFEEECEDNNNIVSMLLLPLSWVVRLRLVNY